MPVMPQTGQIFIPCCVPDAGGPQRQLQRFAHAYSSATAFQLLRGKHCTAAIPSDVLPQLAAIALTWCQSMLLMPNLSTMAGFCTMQQSQSQAWRLLASQRTMHVLPDWANSELADMRPLWHTCSKQPAFSTSMKTITAQLRRGCKP